MGIDIALFVGANMLLSQCTGGAAGRQPNSSRPCVAPPLWGSIELVASHGVASPVVLLVEHDDAHAEIVGRGLASSGVEHDLRRLDDGERAAEIVTTPPGSGADRPALVLLALHLPDLGGLEVLARIRNSRAAWGIPIVVLTSSEDDRDITRAYELQANAYVVKPLDAPSFEDMIRGLAVFWLSWNRRPLGGILDPG